MFLADCFNEQFPPNRTRNPDFAKIVQHVVDSILSFYITAEPSQIMREDSGRLV